MARRAPATFTNTYDVDRDFYRDLKKYVVCKHSKQSVKQREQEMMAQHSSTTTDCAGKISIFIYEHLIARNFMTVADSRNPGLKVPFILGWTGMRGVVALAAALSIPVELANGTPFPQRNLILFVTFIVILLTLLIQGLTLPYIIRKIRIPNLDNILPDDEMYKLVRQQLAVYSLDYLKTHYGDQIGNHSALQQMSLKWEESSHKDDDAFMSDESKAIYIDILAEQRKWLLNKNSQEVN